MVAPPAALCELPRMSQFQDKVVVVTGSGRGIGKEIARAFVARGAKVAIASRTEANSNAAAAELSAMGPGMAKGYAVDIANHDATVEFGKQVAADLGAVSILVNNAGVTRDGLALRMSEEDWDTVLDTNLKGAFLCSRAAAKRMIKQRDGSIVQIGSYSALNPPVGQAAYAASKAGLIGLTKSLAKELGPRNIRVNCVLPGFLETRMTAALSAEARAAAIARHALGRFNTVEDAARFIRTLCTLPHVSGQVFQLDSRV